MNETTDQHAMTQSEYVQANNANGAGFLIGIVAMILFVALAKAIGKAVTGSGGKK